MIVDKYSASEQYVLYQANANTFFVKAAEYKNYSYASHYAHNDFSNYMIPAFSHMRVVHVIQKGDSLYLVCSCCLFKHFGIICCHCYKVFACIPLPEDAVICWHKNYGYFCYKIMIQNECPGPKCCISDGSMSQWQVGTGEKVETYFEQTLEDQTALIWSGNRWTRKNEMMSKQSDPVAKASYASKFPHEGVIKDISLSQAANTEAGASVESDSFPPPNDCDESVTALLELNDTSTGSNQENLSVWKTNLARANAHQILMPDYQDLTAVAEYDAETMELAASKISSAVTEVQALVSAKQAAKQGMSASAAPNFVS